MKVASFGYICIVHIVSFLKSIIMNQNTIGAHSGIIWNLLNNNKRWEYCDLKKESGLSDRDLNAAIGWLARENKIQFESGCKDGKEYLFLALNFYY